MGHPDFPDSAETKLRPKGNYRIGAFLKSIDVTHCGSKTYAKGIEFGHQSEGFGPKIKDYVFP